MWVYGEGVWGGYVGGCVGRVCDVVVLGASKDLWDIT